MEGTLEPLFTRELTWYQSTGPHPSPGHSPGCSPQLALLLGSVENASWFHLPRFSGLQFFGARPRNHSCVSCLRCNTWMEDTFFLGNPRHYSPGNPRHYSPVNPRHYSPVNPRHYSPVAHSHQWACDNYFSLSIIVNKHCSGRLPWWFSSKESACDAGALGLIPGLGRSPGERNGYPLHHPCLENFMDRGAWQATVQGITKSRAQLSD